MMAATIQFSLIFCLIGASLAGVAFKKDPPPSTEITIHATNRTSVPTVHHLVDAVELLKEAYAVYSDDVNRAQLYAELFYEKHPETQWSVIAGYTAAYIHSQYYVETIVTMGGGEDRKDPPAKKTTLFLIFSSD